MAVTDRIRKYESSCIPILQFREQHFWDPPKQLLGLGQRSITSFEGLLGKFGLREIHRVTSVHSSRL